MKNSQNLLFSFCCLGSLFCVIFTSAMYRGPNVISISSDEEDVEKVDSPDPLAVDEVSLIALDRKRKKCDDLVVEVPDKDPLEKITIPYENGYISDNEPLKPPAKKSLKTVIDLLSEEEEDEEIVFRPVTMPVKSNRIKPSPVINNIIPEKANILENTADIRLFYLADDINDSESAKENVTNINEVDNGAVLSELLVASEKPLVNVKAVSIMNNNLNSNDITKDNTKDTLIAATTQKIPSLLSRLDAYLNGTTEEDEDAAEVETLDDKTDDNNDDNDQEEEDDDDGDDDADADTSSSSDLDSNHNSPTTSKSLDKSPEACIQRFKTFLRLCALKIKEVDKMKDIFRQKHCKFLKAYKDAGDFVNTNGFQSSLCKDTDVVKKSSNPYDVVMIFLSLYKVLKENRSKPIRSLDEEQKLDHLYQMLKRCTDKIKSLETVEVNFDDEDDSAYYQLQTYRAKAVKVHEKICLRENKSKYLDRMTYAKLDFDRSSYQAINIAINKKYKNNSVFPTFDDLNRLIRRAVKSNGIEISNISLKEEIKTCFVLLGELLQRRRRHELLDSLTDYVDPKLGDPAVKDAELDQKLRENKRIADKKTEEIIEKFCKIQEAGTEVQVSPDPDDSNVEINSSTDEEDE